MMETLGYPIKSTKNNIASKSFLDVCQSCDGWLSPANGCRRAVLRSRNVGIQTHLLEIGRFAALPEKPQKDKHMKIISINPHPKFHEEMAQLLEQSAPVVGIEFTLPKLAYLLTANIDGQHNTTGGQAAITLALTCEIPPHTATYAVVRPDCDALGAIAVLEMRRTLLLEQGDDTVSDEVLARVNWIAQRDAFQFGTWPGTRDVAEIATDERFLWAALTSLCMNTKERLPQRVDLIREWVEFGDCAGLTEALTKVQKDHAIALADYSIVAQESCIVAINAHYFGATDIAYCYAPVAVLANDKFVHPKVEGTYLKYTVCQFQPGKYVDLIGIAEALNELEDDSVGVWIINALGEREFVKALWGGSPGIIGSPQGVSSSLSIEQVLAVVKSHLK